MAEHIPLDWTVTGFEPEVYCLWCFTMWPILSCCRYNIYFVFNDKICFIVVTPASIVHISNKILLFKYVGTIFCNENLFSICFYDGKTLCATKTKSCSELTFQSWRLHRVPTTTPPNHTKTCLKPDLNVTPTTFNLF